jgi:hypothetical protein
MHFYMRLEFKWLKYTTNKFAIFSPMMLCRKDILAFPYNIFFHFSILTFNCKYDIKYKLLSYRYAFISLDAFRIKVWLRCLRDDHSILVRTYKMKAIDSAKILNFNYMFL